MIAESECHRFVVSFFSTLWIYNDEKMSKKWKMSEKQTENLIKINAKESFIFEDEIVRIEMN